LKKASARQLSRSKMSGSNVDTWNLPLALREQLKLNPTYVIQVSWHALLEIL
jgi:hypothetical protein